VTWAGTLNKEHEWWINLYILYQIATFLGFKIQDSEKNFLNPNPRFKVQDSEKNFRKS
jgi:hypothetical protein